MHARRFVGLLLSCTAACTPAKPSEPPAATTVEMRAAEEAPPAEPVHYDEPPAKAEGLLKLIVLRKYLGLGTCGQDRSVGELRCSYTSAGDPQATPPERTLHAFLTDPPGFVLVAGDWQGAVATEKNEVVLADCRFDQKDLFDEVYLGATKGVQGYRYAGRVRVGTATECTFEPYDDLPERMKAAHLVVMHDDSKRKPATLSRSRDEAFDLARRARRQLDRPASRFADVVGRYSDERGAAKRGGSLGAVRLGSMVPEFEFILLATPIGRSSAVFESSFGFHVLERR
jgi:hypothetical protein